MYEDSKSYKSEIWITIKLFFYFLVYGTAIWHLPTSPLLFILGSQSMIGHLSTQQVISRVLDNLFNEKIINSQLSYNWLQ